MVSAVGVVAAIGVVFLLVRGYRRGGSNGMSPTIVPAPRAHAVVLVHGLLGFDHLPVLGTTHEYFRGITGDLSKLGAHVLAPRLPPLASVPERAAALKRFLHQHSVDRAVLVAHSLGGLDARFALSRLGLAESTSALLTIGTPHRGTWIAGLAENIPSRLILGMLGRMGMGSDALRWLSEDSALRFNQEILDASGVFYGSIVGSASRRSLFRNPGLLASYEFMRLWRGDNDCMVPCASQEWGRVVANVEADHWAQIGWNRSFNASAVYENALRNLEASGIHCLDETRNVVAA